MVLGALFAVLLAGVPGAITQLVELVGWASPGGVIPWLAAVLRLYLMKT